MMTEMKVSSYRYSMDKKISRSAMLLDAADFAAVQ
jgi:hypothetical protein